MIVVKVELHSAITGIVTELARAHICNIGGDARSGIYDAQTLKGRKLADFARQQTQRAVVVANYKRQAFHVWNLVTLALKGMGYGEGKAAAGVAVSACKNKQPQRKEGSPEEDELTG